jgi:hypothetical protein
MSPVKPPQRGSDEARHIAMLRGLRATADLEVALPLLAERREGIIQQAIMDFRAGKLTELKAMLAVAALSENLQLVDDLSFASNQGRRAEQKLQQG